MGQTTLVVIIVGGLVGFALVVILILSFTLTPERAEALGTVFSGLTRLVQGIRGKKEEDGGEKTRKQEGRRTDMERGFATGALAAIASILPTKTQVVASTTEPVAKTDVTALGDMVIRDKESAKTTKGDDTVPSATEEVTTQSTNSTGTLQPVSVRPKERATTATATSRDDST